MSQKGESVFVVDGAEFSSFITTRLSYLFHCNPYIPIPPPPPPPPPPAPPRVPYDGLNSTPNLMATKSVRSRTFKIRSPSVSRAPSIAAAIFPKVFV